MEVSEINIKPFAYAISIINGKWKMHILFWLWKKGTLRYSELKRALGHVTHKMLSTQVNVLPPIEAGASCFNENSATDSKELRRLTLSPQA